MDCKRSHIDVLQIIQLLPDSGILECAELALFSVDPTKQKTNTPPRKVSSSVLACLELEITFFNLV